MQTWMWATLGFLLGAIVTGALLTSTYAARSAGWAAERTLLRERVDDLETSLAEDLETSAMLSPLREALGRVERQVGTLERDRVEQFGALRATLARVEGETEELGRATQALAGSLRASTTRGAWGEVQLRRVLEVSGMLAHCDFEEQVRLRTTDGRAIRPDVVVRLPGGRAIVVDAKAPMTHFLDAQIEGLDEDERTALLASHAADLARHVSALAGKDYWSGLADSPELVVCFVPTDAMLGAALAARPSLHEDALGRGVVLVGPGGLLGLLRATAVGWQQEALTDNARELLDLGRELYRRLGTLGGHTARLGRSLTGSIEAYNAMVGALQSRVLVTARRLHDLDLAGDELVTPALVETGIRPLSAQELIDAVSAQDARAELLLDVPTLEPEQDEQRWDAG